MVPAREATMISGRGGGGGVRWLSNSKVESTDGKNHAAFLRGTIPYSRRWRGIATAVLW